MCNSEVDYIFSIYCVNHAILAEVTDNLHFNHGAQILNWRIVIKRQVSIIPLPMDFELLAGQLL
jgi:hypothetical protein